MARALRRAVVILVAVPFAAVVREVAFRVLETVVLGVALRVRVAFIAEVERPAVVRRFAVVGALVFGVAVLLVVVFVAEVVVPPVRRVAADFRVAVAPALRSWLALRRVVSDAFPLAGTGIFTPERRAFERLIATACRDGPALLLASRLFVDCFAAGVSDDLLVRFVPDALRIIFFSGITTNSHAAGNEIVSRTKN